MAVNQKLKGLVIVATYVSSGVKLDAGGFVIVTGKVIKVPPRGPATRLLQEALQAIVASPKRIRR